MLSNLYSAARDPMNAYSILISQAELIHKSKRAKFVFKKRADAETAFSKSGNLVFWLSLISYRLQYSPSPRKASCIKRKRKYAASLAVNEFKTEVKLNSS
ncbi:hypothetical protein HAX54_051613 [Datura stramonium]|uniref:Uncharacterized protein n=1 Tax=Datura stramonium TaxID=4076 RepID=A0ABS8WRK3_DATST|nr:hypothetical protein [Datura stramonium]